MAESGEVSGALDGGAWREGTARECCECAQGGIEAGGEGRAVTGESSGRCDGGEFGDGAKVAGVVVVRPGEGAGEFAVVADDEVADETGAEVFGDEAEGTGCVARRGDGADSGEDDGLAVDGDCDRYRLGAGEQARTDESQGVGAADSGP